MKVFWLKIKIWLSERSYFERQILLIHLTKTYKTTEYLRIEGVLDFIELRMLRTADYLRQRNILGESNVYSYGTPLVFHIGPNIIVCPP